MGAVIGALIVPEPGEWSPGNGRRVEVPRCWKEAQGSTHARRHPRAAEISANVAFSDSLTATPPKPKKPPSVPASAAFRATS